MWKGIPLILAGILLASFTVAQIDFAFAEKNTPDKFAPDRLLVKFKKDVSENKKKDILAENEASEIAEISQIGVKILKVPEHALEKVESAFRNNAAVEFVEKDYLLEPTAIPNDPGFSNQWHLTSINAPDAWDITTGSSSIPIAILDSGVDPTHPDLQGKLISGYNFFNNNNDWSDVCGHGTKVAGSAAAITNNGIGVAGVAQDNPIIPIRITDTNCWGYYSAMSQGIVYAADLGAKAANISFRIFNGDTLTSAAKYMYDRGGWVVASGGNTGKSENYSENPYIISVSATYSSGGITSFSSQGPYIDFAAPGSSIYTTKMGGLYSYVSGTSFSSPITAGVIALILSNNPSMSADQVYDALKNSAVDLGAPGRDDSYGWGLIDAYGALGGTSPPPIDTESPTVTITSPANGTTVIGIVTVSVDASDNVAVSNVELLVDDVFYDQKSSQPYDFSLDTSTLSEGVHILTATAYDTSNNSEFTMNIITVETSTDTNLPLVSIMNPSDGSTIEGMTTVNVDATDDVAVSKVELYVDDILHDEKSNSPYDFMIDANQLAGGSHVLKAKAIDTSNNADSSSVTVDVDQVVSNPTISITNPGDGSTVNGKVTITASISGFTGTPTVKIYIDGMMKATIISSPYEYGWHTKGASVGTHTITAEATSSTESVISSSVDVNIAQKGKGNDKPPHPKKGSQVQSESEYVGISEIQEFGQGVVLMSSSSSTAIEIITFKLSSLSDTTVTNLGQSVSEVAQLHKYLAHSSKAEKREFQDLFHQYRNAVKEKLGIGQGLQNNLIQQDLQKSEIKMNAQFEKIEEDEARENKIKAANELTKQKDELQKIRNKIGMVENFRYNGADKDRLLEELQAEETKLLKKTKVQEAKNNGKKLTEEDVKKIEDAVEEKTKSSSNSGNGNSGDKGNNGKGSNDKGNSGQSDKGNKGGKGKSKK